jgi:hypothetical protein
VQGHPERQNCLLRRAPNSIGYTGPSVPHMGLEVVEFVMRTEEVFAIAVNDDDASQAITVGKLYELICAQLSLPPSPVRPTGTAAPRPLRSKLASSKAPWTREEVWATLVAIVVDQLQVHKDDVRYDARWGEDLRAD